MFHIINNSYILWLCNVSSPRERLGQIHYFLSIWDLLTLIPVCFAGKWRPLPLWVAFVNRETRCIWQESNVWHLLRHFSIFLWGESPSVARVVDFKNSYREIYGECQRANNTCGDSLAQNWLIVRVICFTGVLRKFTPVKICTVRGRNVPLFCRRCRLMPLVKQSFNPNRHCRRREIRVSTWNVVLFILRPLTYSSEKRHSSYEATPLVHRSHEMQRLPDYSFVFG